MWLIFNYKGLKSYILNIEDQKQKLLKFEGPEIYLTLILIIQSYGNGQ